MTNYKLAILIPLAAGLAGCGALAPRDDWRPIDTGREVMFQLALGADALQTAQIQYRSDVREGQPITRAIIGEEPSTQDVAVYFTTVAISHYLISRLLPPRWRDWWQNPTVVYETMIVSKNCMQFKLC